LVLACPRLTQRTMATPEKERTKAAKKAAKAAAKAAKKQAKRAAHGTALPEKKQAADELKEAHVRINRWRLWVAALGVVISLIALILRVVAFVSG